MINETSDLTTCMNSSFCTDTLCQSSSGRSRYIWIAVFGMVLNGMAIAYLALNRKVKPTLRITMVGLSVNDLSFSANLVLLGNPEWTRVSETAACWAMTYVTVASVVVSYFITIQLSLHNYLAVYRPFHSDVILSQFRCASAVVGGCVLGYLLSLACVGLRFQPGLPCFVLVVVPRSGLATACGVCVSCSCVIITLNLKVCLKIRRRNREIQCVNNSRHARLSHIFKGNSTSHDRETLERLFGQRRAGSEVTEEQNNHRNTDKRNECNTSGSNTTLNIILLPITQSQSSDYDISKHTQHSLKSTEMVTLSPSSLPNSDNITLKAISEDKRPNCMCYGVSLEPGCCSSSRVLDKGGVTGDSRKKGVRNKGDNSKDSVRRSRSGTSKTLAIMTWVSCLLTFPLIVELVYGAIWVNDRMQFITNWSGILVSSLLTAHGLCNPLLYGWRLIAWRDLYRKLKVKTGKLSCC